MLESLSHTKDPFWTYSWIIFADTIYGTQDKEDDAKAGIKSTALLFGSHLRVLTGLFGVGFVVFFTIAGITNGSGPLYYAVACGGAAFHIAWQISTWNPDDRRHCLELFKV